MTDPYSDPSTGILHNRLGITDPAALEIAERRISLRRLSVLPSVMPDERGLRQLHAHIFGDIYDWAGQYRSVTMTKDDSLFALPQYLPALMADRFADLAARNHLAGLSRDKFVDAAAHHLAELNAIHPFREGNGRTVRAHLQILGLHAGHPVELERIEPDRWHRASVASFTTDARDMAALIAGLINPLGRGPDPQRRTGGRGRHRER